MGEQSSASDGKPVVETSQSQPTQPQPPRIQQQPTQIVQNSDPDLGSKR